MASPCETSVCAPGLHDGLHLAGGPRGCRPGILRQQAVTARTRGLVIAQQEEAADLVPGTPPKKPARRKPAAKKAPD